MTAMNASYPVQLEVDPAAPQNRLTVLLRAILLIPHLIILYFLGIVQEIVGLLSWILIVITGRFPAGILGFATGLLHWSVRVNAYGSLLTGVYPPFSIDQESGYPVRLSVAGQTTGRSRLTAFFRIILVLPHAIALAVVGILVGLVQIVTWLVAIVLGRVPDGLHAFLAGYNIWGARVEAYYFLLVDDYPPFSFR